MDSPPGFSLPAGIVGSTLAGFGTSVGVWSTEPRMLSGLEPFVARWITTVEAACSRFNPASDLSRVNAAAGTAVYVSTVLVSAVEAALRMAEVTDGLCDPTVGEAVLAAGYDRTFEAVVADGPGPALANRPGGGWRAVQVDAAASTVTVPAGYRLDLGGSAKGWAVDAALEVVGESLLPAFPGAGVCISAGGDLAVTGIPPAGGWPVSIRERLDSVAGVPGRAVRLVRGAMATSGATHRQWQRNGRVGHHIIDPRSGEPGSSPWALVTTFDDSCLVADTVATAAWLLGAAAPARLGEWGVGARLLTGAATEVLVGDLTRWLATEE